MIKNTGAEFKKKWKFEVPPPRIPQKDVKEVIETDVVVVGAGLAGVCTALSAAQAGAKAVLLEKGDTWHARGHGNAVIGSKVQKEKGIEIDRDEVVAEIIKWGGCKNDQRIVTLWADNCGKAFDWLLEMLKGAGIELETSPQTTGAETPLTYEFLPDGQKSVMPVLVSKVIESGVDIRYNTPVVRLIREGKGRVTGVIAQTSGVYKQFNAHAVVLCTGGYEHDREMLACYAPQALHCLSWSYDPPVTTGDGHKMGMWVGAAMQEGPHCCCYEDGGGVHLQTPIFTGIGLPRQPWLNVNILGERYYNEDQLPTGVANADTVQPGHMKWAVWDGKWEEETRRWHTYTGGRSGRIIFNELHQTTPELYEKKIAEGAILKVDTLEELVQKMGVPYETFMATVKRYNELARLGKDLDFGKNPAKLTTIEKPPFYAARMGAAILVTLGGLNINTKLQVIDTDWKVIPGLYAAGNVSGGFFATNYPFSYPGLTHSRAFTFGRLAGLNAANPDL